MGAGGVFVACRSRPTPIIGTVAAVPDPDDEPVATCGPSTSIPVTGAGASAARCTTPPWTTSGPPASASPSCGSSRRNVRAGSMYERWGGSRDPSAKDYPGINEICYLISL
jgi:hypothetical protein